MQNLNNMTNSELWKLSNEGSLTDAYNVYIHCTNDGKGNDKNTGKPLVLYNEWLHN